MRSILLLVLWGGGLLFADVVILNDGRVLSGSVESGNTQELHLKTGDQTQTIDIHQVQAIQFGVSSAATAGPVKAPPEMRTVVLKDGTRVAGRWWSIDANQVHFLVNNQLQDYARSEVLAVTSGDAPSPAASPSTAPTPAQPAAAAKPQPPMERSPGSTPAGAPRAEPAAATVAPQSPAPQTPTPQAASSRPPTLQGPSAKSSSAQGRGVSQPEEIGAVYYWNGRDLTPLERNQAVQRKRGSTQYWEMSGTQSRVRVEEASAMAFIVRLPRGVNPASYSLFPLTTVGSSRETRADTSRKGGIMTWPFEIQINNESGYMTYAFIVKDLPTGEYSFSPSNSNDGYCFGVDSAPGQ